ncbi:MAG: hypothetical protein DRQ88_12200 [Epsilonproteobacteria bacterium]|nr:MAG: hypothetical protein DRQ88_12200 [Campylobacterota bacterium]
MKTLTILIFLYACGFTQESGEGGRSRSEFINSPEMLSANSSAILYQNPIVETDNLTLEADADFSLLVGPQQVITSNQYLEGECYGGITNCFRVLDNINEVPLPKNAGTWGYNPNTTEFLQVNSFWHLKEQVRKFHTELASNFSLAIDSNSGRISSYPSELFSDFRYWREGTTLVLFSNTGFPNNAFYDPANFTLSLGEDSIEKEVKMAQDPSVIYHENGHNLVQLMMNYRNPFKDTGRVDLGSLFYDEAGAINEGLCDWFSYYMNKRTHVFEWAFGRFLNASRPLTESDDLISPPISLEPDSRLTYPRFLDYDPNFPDQPIEDVHYAGQIISYFMVAMVKSLENTCYYTEEQAITGVYGVFSESLAEMGDLTATGRNLLAAGIEPTPHDKYWNNLDENFSREWLNMVTPINFRRFAQTFGRFWLDTFSNTQTNRCPPVSVYPKDLLENIMDNYGLLNFDTYNDDGNYWLHKDGTPVGHSGPRKEVNILNRKRTTVLPKENLIFNPDANAPSAFIFDNRIDMISALQSLQQSGQIGQISPQIQADLAYNNGNGQVSPGELFGISPNLYNDSNSIIGGIQVLSNDWDHVREGKPCNTFEDGWPLVAEGGFDSSDEIIPSITPGDCNYITRTNGLVEPDQNEVTDSIYPVCFIQDLTDTATTWVNQEKYREIQEMDKSKCLYGSDQTKNCYINAIKGANQAVYSKMDPKKSWTGTYQVGSEPVIFNLSNILMFEVNKWTPPGTTIRCRLRARFTNCRDCFENPDWENDDFLDYQYSGGAPFRVIHIEFTVID